MVSGVVYVLVVEPGMRNTGGKPRREVSEKYWMLEGYQKMSKNTQ